MKKIIRNMSKLMSLSLLIATFLLLLPFDSYAEETIRNMEINATIPVGGVIAFWGTKNQIVALKRYELCDGKKVMSRGPLRGAKKPDLRGVFIRGVPVGGGVNIGHPTTGGFDSITSIPTSGTRLTTDQIPAHSHTINDPGHAHGINVPGNAGDIYDNGSNRQASSFFNPGAKATASAKAGITINKTGGGNVHSHAVSHDNRPAFVEMHYIIRVR